MEPATVSKGTTAISATLLAPAGAQAIEECVRTMAPATAITGSPVLIAVSIVVSETVGQLLGGCMANVTLWGAAYATPTGADQIATATTCSPAAGGELALIIREFAAANPNSKARAAKCAMIYAPDHFVNTIGSSALAERFKTVNSSRSIPAGITLANATPAFKAARVRAARRALTRRTVLKCVVL